MRDSVCHFIYLFPNQLNNTLSSLKSELAFVKANSDTITGFTVWSAGAFDTTYVLTVTPNRDGSDQPLWTAAGELALSQVIFFANYT